MDIFGGSLRNRTIFFFWGGGGGALLYILGLFKVKIQNGNIFFGRFFLFFFNFVYA